MTTSEDEDAELAALNVLADPVRRGLYRQVAASPEEVGRDAAAEAAGVSRSLAAFHLDRLVEAGLLAVSYRRLSGRTGPGAGRPAKMYRRAEGEHALSVPPRTYDTASRLLAEVIEAAGLDRKLQAAARAAGEAAGGAEGGAPSEADPLEVLRARGYQPYREPSRDPDHATVRLNNCPFHALADEFPALVCGMNLALIEGLLAGHPDGAEDWTASMDPRPGRCCVALTSKTNQH